FDALQGVDDLIVLGLGRDIVGSAQGGTEEEGGSHRAGASPDVLLLTAPRVVGGGSGGAHRRSSAGTIAACPRAVKAPQMSQEACQESRPPGARESPPRPWGPRYFFRGVTTNIRSISSRGASYSIRLLMPHTPRRPHL